MRQHLQDETRQGWCIARTFSVRRMPKGVLTERLWWMGSLDLSFPFSLGLHIWVTVRWPLWRPVGVVPDPVDRAPCGWSQVWFVSEAPTLCFGLQIWVSLPPAMSHICPALCTLQWAGLMRSKFLHECLLKKPMSEFLSGTCYVWIDFKKKKKKQNPEELIFMGQRSGMVTELRHYLGAVGRASL